MVSALTLFGLDDSLTPAYDICPQGRSGNEASQAMLIASTNNLSQLKTCLLAAPHFLIAEKEAHDIFEKQQTIIHEEWNAICDEAELECITPRHA